MSPLVLILICRICPVVRLLYVRKLYAVRLFAVPVYVPVCLRPHRLMVVLKLISRCRLAPLRVSASVTVSVTAQLPWLLSMT